MREITRYDAADLVTLLDVEHWRTSVGGKPPADFDLRVSSLPIGTSVASGSWSVATPTRSRRSMKRPLHGTS